MTITRKQFLKFAAASLVGAAGAKLVSGAEVVKQAAAPKNGKRWAMAVDFQKCRWDQGCNQCSAGYSRQGARSEVDLEREIPDRLSSAVGSGKSRAHQSPAVAALQPLFFSCLHQGVSDRGYLEARGRCRDDGLASLHWLSLLHGGLSLWL